jgi:dTDP-4-amino-4,6-dideoxygalactose transaminase
MLSAMYGVGINKGDEVICPTYTWWASISPALTLGAVPVFCDIKEDNLTVDPIEVEGKITKRTKAIIIPHLWGNYGEVNEIKKIIRRYSKKIFIIEDVSHSLGGVIGDKKLGALGDVGIFSLQDRKVLSAGEGGLLVTDDYNVYKRAVFLGHYERIKNLQDKEFLRYQNTGGGFKFRIHPLGAALALSQLKTLEERIKKQNELTSYLESELEKIPNIKLFNKNPENYKRGGVINIKGKIINDQFKSDNRKRELEKLSIKEDFYPPLHLEPFFLDSNARFTGEGFLPVVEKLHNELLSFPVFYRGDKEVVKNYVDRIRHILS